MKNILAVVFVSALLIGCGTTAPTSESSARASGASGQVAIKRYPMHGTIVSLNPADKSARIDAGAIGDWMGPMTMNYTIKDDAGYAKLAPGTTFDATVFVQGDDFWVGEIKPAAATAATGKQ